MAQGLELWYCMFHRKLQHGGNFSVIQTGDMITLDVPNRSLTVDVSTEELEQRKQKFKPLLPAAERGYVNLYINHVQQAHLGADMDFLVGHSGSKVSRDSH
ncbi:MAG: dihydroxy-acid dehydratase [Segetibacter sp.]